VKYNWFKAVLLLCLVSQPAFSRSDEAAVALADTALLEPQDAGATTVLQDQIGRLIEMRTAMLDRTAPQPGADCADLGQVSRRVAGLLELNAFTRATVSGLVRAAPSYELRMRTDEELAPVLAAHEERVTEDLMALYELPLVQSAEGPLKGQILGKLRELGTIGATANLGARTAR
jgi:hypothetical protein